MAVAMQYGAPVGVEISKEMTSKDDEEDLDFFEAASKIRDSMRRRPSNCEMIADEPIVQEDSGGTSCQEDFQPNYFYYDDGISEANRETSKQASTPNGEERGVDVFSTRTKFKKLMSETKRIIASTRVFNKPDPLEGIINLDKPLMLVQEIYDKIIGNHQTSVLSKQQAIKLLREDQEQHMKDGGLDHDDPFLIDQEALLEVVRGPKEKHAGKEDQQSDYMPLTILKDDMQTPTKAPLAKNTRTDEGDEKLVREILEGKEDQSVLPEREASIETTGDTVQDEDNEIEGEEPLIGYWMWDNTIRTHKIKMHVAKNADLALHVVVAIIANQVRYERNAIAMSV